MAAARTNPKVAATSAARSTASSSHPPARWTSAKMTWASHCWSSHVIPATVNVKVSVVGMAPVDRISSPARTW